MNIFHEIPKYLILNVFKILGYFKHVTALWGYNSSINMKFIYYL